MALHIHAQLAPWSKCVEFVALDESGGIRRIGVPIVFEPLADGYMIPEPTFRLTPTETQELMDNLWNCGYRPSEGSGSAGALAATERHLQDMRSLVFNKE